MAKAEDTGRILTAEDMFRGGEDPYQRLEIPDLKKSGEAGVVYLKPLSAGAVLSFLEIQEKDPEKGNAAMLALIGEAVVTPAGVCIFNKEALKRIQEISIKAFATLSKAILAMSQDKDDEAGNESGEVSGDASPTG